MSYLVISDYFPHLSRQDTNSSNLIEMFINLHFYSTFQFYSTLQMEKVSFKIGLELHFYEGGFTKYIVMVDIVKVH